MLLDDIGLSLLRWLIGLVLGSLIGLFLAVIGQIRNMSHGWYGKILDFFRAIPIIGLVPIIQINFGVNEIGKIGLIAWGVMFPVWLTIRFAISKAMQDSKLMIIGAQLDDFKYLKIFVWPKIFGGFINGIEIGIGIAWLCVVAAEWVGTYSKGFWSGGLGYRLIVEYQNNNWGPMHLCLLLFGVLGTATTFFWKQIMKFLPHKSRGFDPIRWLKHG